MKPWLKFEKRERKRKRQKEKIIKKKIINLSFHWVIGPLASLSIERSRKKMRNSSMASLAS
jgi:hypothetical protein